VPAGAAGARTLAIAGGKGGVGKSNIALNLAIALAAEEQRVCLLDANLGLGNIDLLCGLNGYWNLEHVLSGARTLRQILLEGPGGVRVIPGAAGLIELADCPAGAQRDLLAQLREVEAEHDFVILDTGGGIHRTVRSFIAAADSALIVATPELTAVADAYATIKALSAGGPADLQVLVNRAESARQAGALFDRIRKTTEVFVHAEIGLAGCIPEDPHVPRAVAARRPFVASHPYCPAARAIGELARKLAAGTPSRASAGSFFSRILDRFLSRAA
jgi:flagellar biosynthesis protein FlhG